MAIRLGEGFKVKLTPETDLESTVFRFENKTNERAVIADGKAGAVMEAHALKTGLDA